MIGLSRGILTSFLACTMLSGCGLIPSGPLLEDVVLPAVEVQTSGGSFTIAFDPTVAPETTAFFLANLRNGAYSDALVYRASAGARIEAGGFERGLVQKATRPPIQNESIGGRSNLRGTVAMARTSDPDSATSQFYVNLVDDVQLDAVNGAPGYTVFGTVSAGISLFDRLAALPTGVRSGLENVPVEDVVITGSTRTVAADGAIVVSMTTTAGEFALTLDSAAAPLSVANFVQYADDGFYVGTLFHRAVPGFVVQGGGFERGLAERDGATLTINESSPDRPNVRGSVALIFDAERSVVTPRFAVSLSGQPDLDATEERPGSPVFGTIISGIEVVESLAGVAVGAQGGLSEVPVEPIRIESLTETTVNTGEQQLSPDGEQLVLRGRATAYNFFRETFLALVDGLLSR